MGKYFYTVPVHTGIHGTNERHYRTDQGVTKRCRLSWLTNSSLAYEPKWWEGGVAGPQPMSTAVQEPK